MDVLTWILSGIVAAVFLGAGANKLVQSKEKLLTNEQMAWAEDYEPGQLRAIGASEVLGAIGVVLPWLLDVAKVLTPIAALGLAIVMVGAFRTHLRRGESAMYPVTIALFVLAVVVAVLRFTQL